MQPVRLLKVFIGSPDDASHLRTAAKAIVESVSSALELQNLLLKPTIGALDAHPNVGVEPQAVVNDQLIKSADIAIFIFHSRLGTPTRTYPSGTVEEFEIALARRKSENSVKILVYFDRSPILPTVDAEQLKQLQEFRASLKAKGVYCNECEGETDLRDRLYKALYSAAVEVSALEVANAIGSEAQLLEDEIADGDGILDFLTRLASVQDDLNRETVEFSARMEAFNARLRSAAEEVRLVSANGDPAFQRATFDRVAAMMNAHANELRGPVDRVASLTRTVVSDIEGVLSELVRGEVPSDAPGIVEMMQTLRALHFTISQSAQGFREAEESARSVPGFTKSLKVSRRAVAQEYGKIRGALEEACDRLDAALRRLSR